MVVVVVGGGRAAAECAERESSGGGRGGRAAGSAAVAAHGVAVGGRTLQVLEERAQPDGEGGGEDEVAHPHQLGEVEHPPAEDEEEAHGEHADRRRRDEARLRCEQKV